MKVGRIDTNELRDLADTLAPEVRDYLHRVAHELDAARTDRNLARADVKVVQCTTPLKAPGS